MASKKVEFKKIKLMDAATQTECDFTLLKSIIDKIENEVSKKTEKCKSIDLSPNIKADAAEPKYILDIIESYSGYFFGRMCKQKDKNAILKRDYSTLEYDDVYPDSEKEKVGIETFTYFIIDYKTGIVSTIIAKDAPGISKLNALFHAYNAKYYLEYENIPNKNGIELFYKSEGPVITQFQFDIANPSAELLLDVLGVKEPIVLDTMKNGVKNATLILKAEPREKIETNYEKIKKVLKYFLNKKEDYEGIKVKGRSKEFNSYVYDLKEEFFYYPVDINSMHSVKGVSVPYTLDEMTNQFENGLVKAYNSNKRAICAIADRKEN